MARISTLARRVSLVVVPLLVIAIAGCANESVWTRDDLAQRIAQARTRGDHEAIAVLFEQEATIARKNADDHRRMMQRYADMQQRPTRGVLQMAPYADLEERPPGEAADFVKLCESRILASEQAANEYLAFARAHRQLAAEAPH